jgi:hypothetical protein
MLELLERDDAGWLWLAVGVAALVLLLVVFSNGMNN